MLCTVTLLGQRAALGLPAMHARTMQTCNSESTINSNVVVVVVVRLSVGPTLICYHEGTVGCNFLHLLMTVVMEAQ